MNPIVRFISLVGLLVIMVLNLISAHQAQSLITQLRRDRDNWQARAHAAERIVCNEPPPLVAVGHLVITVDTVGIICDSWDMEHPAFRPGLDTVSLLP